jgi:hypothetical protein
VLLMWMQFNTEDAATRRRHNRENINSLLYIKDIRENIQTLEDAKEYIVS